MSFQFDNHKNLAVGRILAVPATYTPISVFALQPGEGTRFNVSMPVTMVPSGQAPEHNNAEIGYIDDIQGDEVSVVRAQEGTEARDVKAGWIILGTTTAKTLTDIESAIQATSDAVNAIPSDHGDLTGLDSDDHTQYHTDGRGDARYYKKAEVDTALSDKATKITLDAYSIPYRNSFVAGEPTDSVKLVASSAEALSAARRTSIGTIYVATPGAAGEAANKAYVDALVPIYGTGFPNGVVNASPGRIYIDTAVTNGASSWIKKAGTGNTGWDVLEGDTGWRNVTSLSSIIESGNIYLRRTASRTDVMFSDVNTGVNTGTVVFYSHPSGFVPSRSSFNAPILVSTTVVKRLLISTSQAQVYAVAPGDSLNGQFSYHTSSGGWPTSLPGIAA